MTLQAIYSSRYRLRLSFFSFSFSSFFTQISRARRGNISGVNGDISIEILHKPGDYANEQRRTGWDQVGRPDRVPRCWYQLNWIWRVLLTLRGDKQRRQRARLNAQDAYDGQERAEGGETRGGIEVFEASGQNEEWWLENPRESRARLFTARSGA